MPRVIKNMAIRNRTAGHNYERQIVKEFKEMGFKHAKTSRLASRLYDDCKLDLFGIPFNLQCKNSKASINSGQILKDMIGAVKEELPERIDLPFLIFHKKEKQEMVTMPKMDFYRILNQIKPV